MARSDLLQDRGERVSCSWLLCGEWLCSIYSKEYTYLPYFKWHICGVWNTRLLSLSVNMKVH